MPPRESKKILDDELKAAHRAGLTEIEKVERVPWDSYDTGAALRFPNQAQFHPLKYLAGLAQAIKKKAEESTPGRMLRKLKAVRKRGSRLPIVAWLLPMRLWLPPTRRLTT